MDVDTAYEVLGLPPGSDLDRVRRACHERGLQIDDLLTGVGNAQRRAEARAELNAAWSTINSAAKHAASPPAPEQNLVRSSEPVYVGQSANVAALGAAAGLQNSYFPQPSYQSAPYQSAPYQSAPYQSAPYQSAPYQSAPYQSAPTPYCQHCGNLPAAAVKLSVTRGYLVFIRWQPETEILCRLCADATYNDAQAKSLMYGWWSLLLAPIINVVNMIRNRRAITAHRRAVSLPQANASQAPKMSAYPRSSKTALKRRAPWVCTIGFVLLASLYVTGRVYVDANTPTNHLVAGSLIECFDSDAHAVDCSAPAAVQELRGPFYSEPNCRASEVPLYNSKTSHYWCRRDLP